MKYYHDLTKDKKRVEAFKKIIQDNVHGIVYDLGTGSGILASFASENALKVYALEYNPFIIKNTLKNFEKYDNIELIETDASTFEFKEKPDVVICEMLDTALIDEEQVPVINNVLKYSKKDTLFIPEAVINTIQIIDSGVKYVTYYENNKPEYKELSEEIKYQKISFNNHIDPSFKTSIKIRTTASGNLNSIKLTTYTILSDDTCLEPTPMLNPPLLLPINNINIKKDEELIVELNYVMGGGLNTIHANIRRNI